MSAEPADTDLHKGAVRAWLLAVAALIFAIVVVGGATRMTESGLSIVEWKPVSGMVPPLDDTQWRGEFEKYQAIPQFRLVNRQMSLGEFKVIYWWEWTHRQLGRLIALVFLAPLLWFLWRGWIAQELRGRLWLIFGLGALQGAVGWWMVASGLTERTEVSQYRLATHLLLACLIFTATLWTAQGLQRRAPVTFSGRIRARALVLVVLILVQLYLGGLLAGLRGGLIYNTWPSIDGSFLPPLHELFSLTPAWRNAFENVLTVQFDHRMMAYAVWLIALWQVVDVARSAGLPAIRGALILFAAVTLQAGLGILTLLSAAPMGLALPHQAMAVAVLALAVVHAERLMPRGALEEPAPAPAPAGLRSGSRA